MESRRPRVIVTPLRGHTPDPERVKKAEEEVKRLEEEWKSALSLLPETTALLLERDRKRGLRLYTDTSRAPERVFELGNKLNKALRELANAQSLASRKPTKDRIRLTVIGGYEIREKLKERGYRFERDVYWSDPFGMKVQSGWFKDIPVDDLAALEQEGEWLDKHAEAELDTPLATLGANIREKLFSKGGENGVG